VLPVVLGAAVPELGVGEPEFGYVGPEGGYEDPVLGKLEPALGELELGVVLGNEEPEFVDGKPEDELPVDPGISGGGVSGMRA
jgi:hypothetical protein